MAGHKPHRVVLTVWLAVLASPVPSSAEPSGRQDPVAVRFFERRIRPVLRKHCFKCHSANTKTPKGKLRVDFRDGLRIGGDSGPAVIPGRPDNSLLIKALEHKGPKMPPQGKLPRNVVADFRMWIRTGASDPRDKPTTRDSASPVRLQPEDARAFWSWKPLEQPPIPVFDDSWIRNPIDAFVAARHHRAGLTPAPQASSATLLRRASFDLLGLPPSSRDLAAFQRSSVPGRWPSLVDRLLADPRFGERWARHWLDVARFAESDGFEMDYDRPEAWRYRDFVVGAMNRDMPFDEFVRWQLAGDRLRPENPWATVATGFLVAGVENRIQSRKDFVQQRYDKLDDFSATTATAMLGLTIGCARCHDHKYDPISQRDYYSFTAAFAETVSGVRRFQAAEGTFSVYAVSEVTNHRIRMVVATEPSFKGLPSIPSSVRFLVRGDPDNAREVSSTGFPPFLISPRVSQSRWLDRRSVEPGRVGLARWMTDDRHGAGHLLARVIVNRLWHHHFGHGLAATPNDFGTRGDRPTHPQLLDWLASTLIANGWHLKSIHRLILTSATYRMGYQSPVSASVRNGTHPDPQNLLYWRREPKRLEAEAIRDSLLAVSGRLDSTMHGPGTLNQEHPRRSIYLRIKRSRLIPVLQLFDGPDSLQSIGQRSITTTAPQALLMLNNPFVQRSAELFAQGLSRVNRTENNDVITRGFVVATGRRPTAEEYRLATVVLADGSEEKVFDFCRMLLCLNEFLYIE